MSLTRSNVRLSVLIALIPLISTLFLTNSFTTSARAASFKVGSTCPHWHIEKKVNGKLYLCSKMGKKLTWQPSVAEIQKTIWRDLQKRKTAQPSVRTSLDIHYSPTVSREFAAAILRGIDSSAQLWQQQYLPKSPLLTLFFSEKDRDWFISEMKALGVASEMQLANFDNEVVRNGDRASWAGVTGEGGVTWLVFMVGTGRTEIDRNMIEVSAHEYAHLAQFAIADRNQEILSCWQVEGGAAFYGGYVGSKSIKDLLSSNQVRNNDRGSDGFEGIINTPAGEIEPLLDSFGPNYNNQKCGPDGAFFLGSIAHEYLYTLKGHDGIIALLKNVAAEGNFEVASLKTYGKSWPVLRKEIASYVRLLVSQS